MTDHISMVRDIGVALGHSVMGAQHYAPTEDVWLFAKQIRTAAVPGCGDKIRSDEWHMPVDARLPAATITLTLPERRYGFYMEELSGSVLVSGGLDATRFESLGSYVPGGEFRIIERPDQADVDKAAYLITFAAFVVAVINQPRIVSKTRSVSRQVERRALRDINAPVGAFTKIAWDLSKATVAKHVEESSGVKMPYHWVRGYWRQAEPHHAGAVQRPGALREEDRERWWQWVGDYWRGHPAFGTRISVHAPTMTKGRLAVAADARAA